MKLNKGAQIDYKSNATFDGYDAQISPEDMDKLWDLLQDPYKNSIGAVVREYVSNSFDAHSEAEFIKNNSFEAIRKEYSIYKGIDDTELAELQNNLQVYNNDAVTVTIGRDDTGHFWSTEDIGVGLSPDRVRNVFCNYLKSTKEATNNVIGAFGIGSKSGLSYTDIVFIRARYNGTETQYMLRKGEKSPRLDIVSSYDTKERNGTEIKIYFKNTNEDESTFISECERQLAYFDNVYFNNCEIENDYVILKGDNWLLSSNAVPFSGLHLCLGKVAYPIDWDELKIPQISLPVALKFEIGELDIIQTREDVKYTPKTKKVILDKIEKLKKELQIKWRTENNYQTDDLLKYLLNKDEDPKLEYNIDNHNFVLDLYLLYSESEYRGTNNYKNHFPTWEFIPFKAIDLEPDFEYNKGFFEYACNSYINETGLKHRGRGVENMLYLDSTYRILEEHNPKKSKYIRHALESDDVYLIRKNKRAISLGNYVKNLKLQWEDRANWRSKIQIFQKEIQKCVVANTKSYDKVVVDQQWLRDTYAKKRKLDTTKLNGYTYDVGQGYYGKWMNIKYVKGQLDKHTRTLFIVGTKEQKDDLLRIGQMYEDEKKLFLSSQNGFMRIIYSAVSNLQYFEDIKNLVTVGNFKEKKPFVRQMTAYHIKRSPKYDIVKEMINRSSINWADIYDKLPDAIGSLKNYLENNDIESHMSHSASDWLKECYEYALENNIFEKSILNTLDFIYEYFKDIPLLPFIEWRNINSEEVAKAIYRYNKGVPVKKMKKLNPHYYVNLNQEEHSWLSEKDKSRLAYIKE